MIAERLVEQTGDGAKALLNRTPEFARESMFGVCSKFIGSL
jgi:hypothetical protein